MLKNYLLNEFRDNPGSFMKVPEASEYAHVSKETIRNWIRDFKIGGKIGGRWYIKKDLLDKVLCGDLTYKTQGRPPEDRI